MTVIPFTSGWTFRPFAGPFAGAMGGAAVAAPARLPHDALRDEERTPHAASKGGGAYYPGGAFTYLRDLDVPEDWRGKVVRLEFQGVYRHAQVFINDELAGNRADGYARFFVDVTPYLRFGATNLIRVEARAGEDSRWYSGAGLHRPVVLHVDEAVHIEPDGIDIRTLRIEPDHAVVEVRTLVTNRQLNTETVRVRTRLTDAGGSLVEADETPLTLAPGETATARQLLYVDAPALWSPADPRLHVATVGLVGRGDPHEVNVGIRTVTVHPRHGLRINGEPVLLRGACVHHDNGPLGAAALGRAEERRIELLKDAGFNAIRAAHNPVSVAMLDACDRLGMLVMDEAFDMWTRFKTPFDYSHDFPQWWAQDIEAMVAKDRNHPSVIMYSIGNEIAEVGTPHGARWARRLADHVRALDPTRPVTNGVNAFLGIIDEVAGIIDEVAGIIEELGGLNAAMASGDGPFNAVAASATATARIEESSAALDVLGLNYADSRYAQDAIDFPHRVIVGSETFASQIGKLWPLVLENPNVIGDFTWTGWDYLGEVGIGSTSYEDDPEASRALEREYPYLTAWTGDIDITGWRRPISYYRETVFGLRAEPYIAVHRPDRHGVAIANSSPWGWSDSVSSWTWSGFEGRPVTVEVYADADEVALLLNGEPVASAAVGTRLPMLAEIETEYRAGTLTAVATKGGVEVGRTTLVTAASPGLVVTADRTAVSADDADAAFVAIELRDAAGILVTDADRPVTVSVEGAQLAGLCSANPKTAERFDAATWRTFDGRALAVIRPTEPGTITVRVTSGDESAEVTLSALG